MMDSPFFDIEIISPMAKLKSLKLISEWTTDKEVPISNAKLMCGRKLLKGELNPATVL